MGPTAAEITRELLDERLRRLRTSLVFDQFCRLLRAAGVPLDRSSLSLHRLHPLMVARTFHWDIDSGGALAVDRTHEVADHPAYRASPIAAMARDGMPIRRRLLDPACPLDFGVLPRLRAEGYRDYLVTPLLFADGQINSLSLATRHATGFAEADLALLDRCLPALALVLEVQQMRDVAHTLLATYVGPRTSQRVWEGTIRRGHGETVFAILSICDLRGFTELAARLPLPDTIALLNDFFDAMGGAVVRQGGEILKFMGDALLAIFPCDRAAHRDCNLAAAALAAAQEGLAALAAGNRARQGGQGEPLSAGVALAVGDVIYGNIGVADRLDFTVIGPAVNLAARLQTLTASLAEPILLSSEVARRLPLPTRSCGQHRLKGVAEPVEVFAP